MGCNESRITKVQGRTDSASSIPRARKIESSNSPLRHSGGNRDVEITEESLRDAIKKIFEEYDT
jgi:hypothetical protein